MYHKRFQQGDKVSYSGSKFAKELHGKLGIVCGHVANQEGGIVVDFGEDSYVLDENRHLTRFQGKEKKEGEQDDKGKGGPEVTKRKTKKRVVDQEADA